MKIGIQTWGSHGDIRPLLALAEGLQSSGHDVTLVITCVDSAEYNSSIANSSVKIKSVASPVILDKEELARIEDSIFSESNPVKQVQMIIAQLFMPVEAEMYQEAENLCADNDLVIGHFFHYPLQTAAEKAGCPYVSIMLVHSAIPSSLSPPVGFPQLGRIGNRFAWWLVKSVLNKILKSYPDKLRVSHGLKAANDLVSDVWASHDLTIIAVSPEICQRQSDWPDHYKISGFFDMPNISIEGKISEELEEFLSHDDPPIYITFGSAMPSDILSQKETIKLLSEAVRITNCRAVIQASLWQECGFSHTQNIHYVHSSPYRMVFPRCRAIIHHGGAGTTQAATHAGKPSIVVAHIAEQVFWGRELKRIGVSPSLLLRQKMSAEQLSKSISDVIGSSEMSEKAKKIGTAMKKENGVEVAVKLINEKFNI